MPRVIGATDGSHIAIQAPTHRADDYVNRKGVHSVILQAVVDPNMLFIDIYAGELGSLHDARVLRKSPLFAKAQQQMGSLFHNASVLVGDAAYPCLPWLVTPFRDNGHLSQQQKEFNHAHSTTRIVVEQSFGLLKGCFRKLQHLCMTDVDEMPRVIYWLVVCCTTSAYLMVLKHITSPCQMTTATVQKLELHVTPLTVCVIRSCLPCTVLKGD